MKTTTSSDFYSDNSHFVCEGDSMDEGPAPDSWGAITFNLNVRPSHPRVYTSTYFPRPSERKPWTGNLLPAVVEVFDHEIDIETASALSLETKADKVLREVAADYSASVKVLEPIEKKHAALIKEGQTLKARLDILTAAILYKEAAMASGNKLYSGFQDELKQALTEAHGDKSPMSEEDMRKRALAEARKVEEELHNARLAKHNVSKDAKKLYRELNKLTHPDSNNNDPVLLELFKQGQEAMKAQDLVYLQDLISEARDYKAGNRKANRLKAAKAKLKRAKARLAEARQEQQAFSRSFNNRALRMSNRGQLAQVEAEFEHMVNMQVVTQKAQIQQLELIAKGYGLVV